MPLKSTLPASRLAWLMLLFVALVIGVAALRFRGWQAAAKSQKVKIESAVTLQAKGRGGAEINFANGATIPTEYSGHSEFSQARPLTLAAGDFDGDGVDDLMSGYATPNGGLLALHRGNIESIFPGPSEIQPSPFFPEAKTFAALEQPDFLVVGDFNNDGRQDAVTARRDGDALNFFKGDGQGNLQSAERISLDGKVTALAAGELNRNDGLTDLAVGIVGADGAKVLIFESWNGALSEPSAPAGGLSEPLALAGGSDESFVLPNAATAFAVVSLAEDGFGDLVIAAGNELLVLHGRDRQLTLNKEGRRESSVVISRQTFEAEIVALTTGRFTDGATNEVAVLTDDSSLYMVAQELAGASPGSPAGQPRWGGSRPSQPERVRKLNDSIATGPQDDASKTSHINLQVRKGGFHPSGAAPPGTPGLPPLIAANPQSGRNALVAARVSANGATDDLILLDQANSKMHVLKTAQEFEGVVSGKNSGQGTTPPEGGTLNALSVAASFEGELIAAITPPDWFNSV